MCFVCGWHSFWVTIPIYPTLPYYICTVGTILCSTVHTVFIIKQYYTIENNNYRWSNCIGKSIVINMQY